MKNRQILIKIRITNDIVKQCGLVKSRLNTDKDDKIM